MRLTEQKHSDTVLDMTTNLITAIQFLIRREAQRLTIDGHSFATAIQLVSVRGI